MAKRMDRVGRKAEMSMELYRGFKREPQRWFKVWELCRKMGVKTSTRFKKMAHELWSEDENILAVTEDGQTLYAWRPHKQIELPDRFITINGKSHKVANWVMDEREYHA